VKFLISVVDEFPLKSVALAKILKERSVAAAGTVRTGTVGKPPTLFRTEDVRTAVTAHQEKQTASRAAAAAARQLKKGVVPANTDEPQTIDSSEVTEVVAQTG